MLKRSIQIGEILIFTIPADRYRLYRDEADAAVLQRLDPVPVPVPQLLLVQTSLAQQVGSWRAQFYPVLDNKYDALLQYFNLTF